MDINYTWKITDLVVAPSQSGQTNVVLRAAWDLTGTYTAPDGTEYSHTYNSMTVVPSYQEGQPFTALEDLSPESVWEWVQAKENTKTRNIEWLKTNNIAPKIAEKVNPSEVLIRNWSN
jgi:hypothetical protein